MSYQFSFLRIDGKTGRPSHLKCEANTTGEARANFKRQLGVKSRGRLPVMARSLIERKEIFDSGTPAESSKPRPPRKRRAVPHVPIGHRFIHLADAPGRFQKQSEAERKEATRVRREREQQRHDAIAEKRRAVA